jgi:methylglutaconyl-CoA hydratase
MSAEMVRLEVSADIARITLDSQHNRNALSRQLVGELHAALDRCGGSRVIVLTHAGPTFCSGADLRERSEPNAVIDSTPMAAVMERLIASECPTIAALNGAARAGGVGLMAACDIVVVAPTLTFAFSEVRLGVAPAVIAVPVLRRVSASAVRSAMLTGDPFDAEYAREIGLVTYIDDDVERRVDQLCESLLAASPRAIAATKQLLARVPGLDYRTAFAQMSALSDDLFRRPDGVEGMLAFREKRTPVWPT